MRLITFSLVTLVSAVPAIAQDRSTPVGAKQAADYVRVEVRGDLRVTGDYKFDPKADPKSTDLLRATVSGGNSLGFLPLLVEDRKHFDLVKANNGKKVVVTGELESVVLPYDAAHPPAVLPVKFYVRVRDIRLADQK